MGYYLLDFIRFSESIALFGSYFHSTDRHYNLFVAVVIKRKTLELKMDAFRMWCLRRSTVYEAWRRDHITPVLRDLHWLPVRRRVVQVIALLVYKSLHGLACVWLGGRVVRKLDLRSVGREFESWPLRYRVQPRASC